MKGRISDKERLLHVLDAIKSIEEFTLGLSYDQYMDDYKLRLAVVKLFEIIGEAFSAISPDLQNSYPEIEWNVIKSARNVLVHEYFGIDYIIVWNSIKDNIPLLKGQINRSLIN